MYVMYAYKDTYRYSTALIKRRIYICTRTRSRDLILVETLPMFPQAKRDRDVAKNKFTEPGVRSTTPVTPHERNDRPGIARSPW